MFLLTSIVSLNKKLVAYDFVNDSGLSKTAEKTGFTASIFSDNLFLGISQVIASILSLLGIIFLGLLIYAGFTWMTAEGDESKIEKAKKIITQALIGLVIILAAYAISFFIINALAPK